MYVVCMFCYAHAIGGTRAHASRAGLRSLTVPPSLGTLPLP